MTFVSERDVKEYKRVKVILSLLLIAGIVQFMIGQPCLGPLAVYSLFNDFRLLLMSRAVRARDLRSGFFNLQIGGKEKAPKSFYED